MRTPTWLLTLAILSSGCGDTNNSGGDGGSRDLSMTLGDGSGGADFAVRLGDGGSGACSTTPMTGDQTVDCTAMNCPSGQVGVSQSPGVCKCFYACDPSTPTQCSCDRLCVSLTSGDAGVVAGACLPGSPAGVRCGNVGNGTPCAQGLTCAGSASGAYCLYNCLSQADCPAQTQCSPITNAMQMVVGMTCAYVSNDTNGLANGMTCAQATDHCMTGYLCGATCDQQCDGTGAAGCSSGTCKVLSDTATAKVIGYTCQP